MDDDAIRRRLREAAEAHRPDRARILARVERGIAAPPEGPADRRRLPAPWPRALAAAASVAALLVVGGFGAAQLAGRDDPPAVSPAPPPQTPLPAPRASGAVDPGSNRWWAQSNLTLDTPTRLSTLTVELRIAQTGGVASTGHWRTRDAEDFAVTVREEGPALVYRWTLKPGRTVPPGRHVFAGQYNHAEGERDATGDAFTIATTGSGGEPVTVRGDFTNSAR
ncbi:hypothetical protein [Streptomyces vilmorinianum]|uniref:hypothetical protein n=1 Tax=Streptomyces vilmorinianum TaxID=3051092 RepID=UPI0010FB6FB1|nr:hypothetical protein [Streptomyces vilmorinianum]